MVIGMHCGLLVASRRNGVANPEITWGETKGRAVLALQLGVYVFFVLSGYLLSRPFIRSFTYGRPQPNPGRYFERRLLRIVPAFWIACIALLIIYGTQHSSTGQIVAMFGFAQTYHPGLVNGWMGQAWTLDCEMLFYFLLPLTTVLLAISVGRMNRGRARLALITALLIGGAYAGYQLRWLGVGVGHRGAAPLGLLRAFLPGIGLAAVEVLASDRLSGKRWGPWAALLSVGLGIAALATTLKMNQASLDIEWAGIVAGTFLVGGPLLMEWTADRSWRLLDNRLLQWLGERSYGIYLLHALVIGKLGPLISASRGPTSQWIVISLICAGITTFFAAILYRLVEVPAMQLGRRGVFRRTRVAAEAA